VNRDSTEEEPTTSDSLKVTLVYALRGEVHPFELNIPLANGAIDLNVLPYAVGETFSEIEKDIHFSDYYDELPDPTFLQKNIPRPYAPAEWNGDEHRFQSNSQQVWHEISNTLLSAKFSLAQSRAYKDVELSMIEQGADADANASGLLNIHFSKMSAFDGAVYRLAKIEDLFLQLLFVNLGNSLVETDLTSADWPKKLYWDGVKKALKQRHPKAVSNRYLNQLPDAEYVSILEVFRKFKTPQEVTDIVNYRNATTHRISLSVDYPGIGALLNFSEWGSIQTHNFVRRFKVDHQFLDLYQKAIKVYSHYIQVLGELKAVPRFA
jgi:hypothetical protein